jgi:hypothetical protein
LNETDLGVPSLAALVCLLLRGALGGQARHDGAGGAVGAGVVPDQVGVGLPQLDLVHLGAQGLRGQLPVHGGGAVAELRRPDPERVPAVSTLGDAGVGVVAARRHRIEHRHRHPGAGQPAGSRRRGVPAAAGQRGRH